MHLLWVVLHDHVLASYRIRDEVLLRYLLLRLVFRRRHVDSEFASSLLDTVLRLQLQLAVLVWSQQLLGIHITVWYLQHRHLSLRVGNDHIGLLTSDGWDHTTRPVPLLEELLRHRHLLRVLLSNHLLFTLVDLRRSIHLSHFLLHHGKDLLLHKRIGGLGSLAIAIGCRTRRNELLSMALSILLHVGLSDLLLNLHLHALLDHCVSILSRVSLLTCSAGAGSHKILSGLRLGKEVLGLTSDFEQRSLNEPQVLHRIALREHHQMTLVKGLLGFDLLTILYLGLDPTVGPAKRLFLEFGRVRLSKIVLAHNHVCDGILSASLFLPDDELLATHGSLSTGRSNVRYVRLDLETLLLRDRSTGALRFGRLPRCFTVRSGLCMNTGLPHFESFLLL